MYLGFSLTWTSVMHNIPRCNKRLLREHQALRFHFEGRQQCCSSHDRDVSGEAGNSHPVAEHQTPVGQTPGPGTGARRHLRREFQKPDAIMWNGYDLSTHSSQGLWLLRLEYRFIPDQESQMFALSELNTQRHWELDQIKFSYKLQD